MFDSLKRKDLDVYKIITLGFTNVGKSSILNKFIYNSFNDCVSHTVGIDSVNKELVIKNTPVILQIWDTAGQERFNTIVKSYYRGCHGFIFVYDVCEERTFEYIKEKIKIVSKENQINHGVLLCNKIDLIKDKNRLVSEKNKMMELCKDYGFDFYLTSAKSGENINKMFEVLAKKIMSTGISKEETKNKINVKRKFKKCC